MKSVLAFFLFTMPLSAIADVFPSSHTCRKPYKPYKFTSQMEVDSFNNDVSRYKQCIKKFVEEQNSEAENHQRAASDAIDEWNRYAK